MAEFSAAKAHARRIVALLKPLQELESVFVEGDRAADLIALAESSAASANNKASKILAEAESHVAGLVDKGKAKIKTLSNEEEEIKIRLASLRENLDRATVEHQNFVKNLYEKKVRLQHKFDVLNKELDETISKKTKLRDEIVTDLAAMKAKI